MGAVVALLRAHKQDSAVLGVQKLQAPLKSGRIDVILRIHELDAARLNGLPQLLKLPLDLPVGLLLCKALRTVRRFKISGQRLFTDDMLFALYGRLYHLLVEKRGRNHVDDVDLRVL